MGSEWKRYSFESCMDAIIDYRGKTPKKTNSGIPLITAKIIKNGSIQSVNEFIAEEDYDSWMRRGIPESGDIVLTTEAPLGEVAQLDDRKIALAQRVITLRGKKGFLDNTFLKYLLLSNDVQHQLDGRGTGTTVKGIKQSELRKIELPIPEYEVQKSIAHILSTLDNKIQLNRQTNQTLEKMAQALFKSWFVDFDPVIDNALAAGNPIPPELEKKAAQRAQVRAVAQASQAKPGAHPHHHTSELPQHLRELFPSEFEHTEALGWVPKGWGVKALDEIAHYQNGLALQKFRPEDEEIFLPVLKISHLKQGFTDGKEKASQNIKASCIVDDGDVIFSWSASLMVDIWCGGKAALNQHLFKVTSDDYPRWFYYSFTIHHLLEFQRIASDKAVTMGHIKKEHLSQAKCVVPSLSFLDKIGKNIGAILDKQVLLRQESNELAKLRDTLLPKLISGELRLPVAETDAPSLTDEASV